MIVIALIKFRLCYKHFLSSRAGADILSSLFFIAYFSVNRIVHRSHFKILIRSR